LLSKYTMKWEPLETLVILLAVEYTNNFVQFHAQKECRVAKSSRLSRDVWSSPIFPVKMDSDGAPFRF